MKLIAGLGNPGEHYKNTRHNLGFKVIDMLAEEMGAEWIFEKKFNSLVAKKSSLILVKPQTFMNRSGEAVRKIIDFYRILPENLVLIHDDVDLLEGEVRFKLGSSSAGHHGVEDVIAKLGTCDFWRVRIGVGRPAENKFEVKDFVLGAQNMAMDSLYNKIKSLLGDFL